MTAHLTQSLALTFDNISKHYYGNTVLKNISFDVRVGEIHGLIGENGAGKSTLMNILFGMPVIHHTGGYEGKVLLYGKPCHIKSPIDAIAHGIGMVHQEFMLIPELSVFENIKLNKEVTKRFFFNAVTPAKLEILDIAKMRKDAQAALKKVGLTLDELLPVAGLPVGHMQFIEIAREIDNRNLKLLVFDEPTAVLTEMDAERFLATMRHLAKDLGIAILFISHRLDEIKAVCDRVTVLRDGEKIGTFDHEHLDIPKMAELMVGRKVHMEIRTKTSRNPSTNSDVALELRDFCVAMPGESVKGVNLQVRRGEILGLAGLAGQGKIGIANGIAGLYPTKGQLYKNGKPLALNNPKSTLQHGIAFLSEDRRNTGLLLDASIANNMAITAVMVKGKFLHKGVLTPLQLLSTREISEYANKMIDTFDCACTGPNQPARRLSGGNQQKVCIARVLAMDPEVLLVSEPTRGVDIGAKTTILQKIYQLNQTQGVTILFTSSELAELRAIADRIAIIADGKLIAILPPDAPDRLFGLAMAGDTKDFQAEVQKMQITIGR